MRCTAQKLWSDLSPILGAESWQVHVRRTQEGMRLVTAREENPYGRPL